MVLGAPDRVPKPCLIHDTLYYSSVKCSFNCGYLNTVFYFFVTESRPRACIDGTRSMLMIKYL